ncbi:hypothetical protein J3458_015327 [Metarhizium acridum]|uniref:uncharacterized protein n=1 Tax=Metarhizium acridum TaxID=92637 RepID=UPI001C6C0F75|nr:hypothetical protein J3458_015327 [Metarhizium acridum]
MVITVTSNADLPKCINTEAKQAKKAKQLAQLYTDIPAKKARGPPTQGFFSRTMIVTLQNGDEVVIQFRPEPMDLHPFKLARQCLGSAVPHIERVQDEELQEDDIWVYAMTRIPGKPWSEGVRGKGPEAIITINKTLGKILSRGYVKANSDDVVHDKVRPHLEQLLSSQDESAAPFKHVANDLLGRLDQIKVLPLFIAHFDLNAMNILVNETCEVSGIVDWELSTPLPFGMGFGRIHDLAGEFSEGEFHVTDQFEEAERGFWHEVIEGVPEHIRRVLEENFDAVQTAVMVGTLLDAFEIMDGEVGSCNPVAAKALPKLLSYRVPFIRGTDPPYSK